MPFGLRYFDDDEEIKLMQVSGGGRIRLSNGKREWWTRNRQFAWEVYETDAGHTFDNAQDAEMVVRNFTV